MKFASQWGEIEGLVKKCVITAVLEKKELFS